MTGLGFKKIAILLCGLSVAIGAIGRHVLMHQGWDDRQLGLFDTALRYQMFQALALLILTWNSEKLTRKIHRAAVAMMTSGVLIFSGSLYLLAATQDPLWAKVTPFGGVLLLISWGLLLF